MKSLNQLKFIATVHCAALLMLSASMPARAAEADDKWVFNSTPFLWASGMEGDITVKGITLDVDLGFEDLFDVTDFGFATYLELRKKKFGFFAAPSYMKLSGDAESRIVKADFEQDFWLVEGGWFYNLVQTQNDKPLTIDATAGLRYWNISTDIDLQPQGPRKRTLEIDGSTVVTDPIIGLRAQQYLTKKLSLNVRGDIGGFGLFGEDSSHFSWQAIGLVGYDLSKKFTLFGGYRALGINADEGSGRSKKGFDVVMNGALVGLQIGF